MPVYPGAFLDHLVRSEQHIRRNRETDLLCSLEIYHQLELSRLLDRKVAGLCAFEDLITSALSRPLSA